MTGVFGNLGIDPFYAFLILLILQVALLVVLVLVYDEMGGELSFAITMLDENNTGWILNIMHSRQGCYAYVKDIVKGESTIQLAEEERESLEKAIFQENK